MASQMLTLQELDRLVAARPASAEPLPATSDSALLRSLASLERSTLAPVITEQHHEPGEIIFRENDSGDAMYLIRSGRVIILKGDLASPTILGYRGPGEVIGEMALLEDAPRSASVVALEKLSLLKITREGFQLLLQSIPSIGGAIMATLSARLRASDNIRNGEERVGRQLASQVSRLQAEKQQLEELARVRQETSDLVVHDLRNPLSLIYGTLHTLEMVLPEEVLQANRGLLNIAHSACGRMQRLVDSLLDVARLEAGEVQLRLAVTDLRSLLEEAVNRGSFAVGGRRRIVIHSVLPADLPPVIVDAEMIDRVLANLMDNAINYMLGEGQITVAAEAQADQVVVSLTDTGPGIPPEDRERIFERFAQRAGPQLRRGFGLGLTFCRLAVQAHGGRIWVEPGEGGVGSRFVFTLPAHRPPTADCG